MPTQANDFTPNLSDFLDRLVELSYYQFFMRAQFKRAGKSMERDFAYMDTKGWPKDAYFFGAGVSMMDIFHTGQFVVRCPTKARTTLGKDVLQMGLETERLFNSFVVALLFEAVERYLKAMFCVWLAEKGTTLELKSVEGFHKSHSGMESRSGTPEYYEKYAKYACRRNCNEAIDLFEQHLDWKRATISECFGMSYHDFIRTLGVCRHRIVHNHGRISVDLLKTLPEPQRKLIESWMYETLHGKERLILPDTRPVDRCFEHLASYGRGLFVLLSDFCGMVDDSTYFQNKYDH